MNGYGPNIAKLPQGATLFHLIVLSICFCSCFYETCMVRRRHGRYCPVTTLPKMITAARDVSRNNFLFYLIFSLLTLPKKSAFGKVTWMGKRRLLPQMTASLYLGQHQHGTAKTVGSHDRHTPLDLLPGRCHVQDRQALRCLVRHRVHALAAQCYS